MLGGLLSLFAYGTCAQKAFFGLPVWYKYLADAGKVAVDPITGRCEISVALTVPDLSLIALAVVEILLRIAALVTVGYIVWGGIQFIVAQGDTGRTTKARQTIINALIGLIIALISTGLVNFVGSRVG